MNNSAKKARGGRKRAILLSGLGIIVLSLGYCSLVPPPDMIKFKYPYAESDPQLTEAFWKYYQAQDTVIVSNTACGDDLAHPIAGMPSSVEALAARRRAKTPDSDIAGTERDLICRFEEYLKINPKDQQATVILSAMYMWRVQMEVDLETKTLDLHEARHHARQAVDNGNDLASGFWASPTMLLGFLNDDTEYKKAAYDALVTHSLKFASFHGYIEGAVLSGVLTPEHKDYKWASISFMENLETCMFGNKMRGIIQLPQGMKMNNLVLNIVASIARLTGRPWCYNNDAAPFNVQGLFLSQGDAYAKQGEWELARIAYQNAINSPNSENWHFTENMQYRIDNMQKLQPKWIEESGKFPVPQDPPPMIFQTSWYCASCHQHAANYQSN